MTAATPKERVALPPKNDTEPVGRPSTPAPIAYTVLSRGHVASSGLSLKSPQDQERASSGVAFFDFRHGQTGVAPNAVERHPILCPANTSTTACTFTRTVDVPPIAD
jgi:hypothetical protein